VDEMAKTLERSLGFWSVFSISVGAMIGSGIFVLPGLAAGKAGPAVVFVYFLAGVIVLPAALSKAELATAIPATGGTYIYLDRSMGPFVGTIGGLGTWFSLSFKSAFALVGLGAYLTLLFPFSNNKYAALALCVGIIALNIGGVKKTAKLQMGIVVCVLTVLTIFIGQGATQLNTDAYSPFMPNGWFGIFAATGFVFISYAGVTKIASIVEEVKRPERNVPLGILASLGVMMVIYTLVVAVLAGTVPLKELKTDITPIATAAEVLFGSIGKNLFAVVAVLALTSMANAGLLSSSRFPFAMSRDNLLPGFLKSVHPKFRTPATSILLTGGMMLLLIIFVDVEKLAKLASAFKILVFCLVNLSVIIFRESHLEWYRPRFRSPGYPWVQLAGIVASLLLLTQMGSWLPLYGVGGIFLGGALWYFVYSRKHADRVGSLARTHERAQEFQEAGGFTSRGKGRKELLVPFYGDESESEIEARIRMATLFSMPDGVVHPVYFEEVPDETLLDVLRDVDEQAETFEAKFRRATHQWGESLRVDTLVTHDAKSALFRAARAIEARWILMGWQRKSLWNFLIQIHSHWWLHHSPCNVAQYLDRGLREMQKIAVMTEPGPYDALLVHVADQLSFVFDAEIVLLHIAEETAPESEIERVERYHNELRQLFRSEVTGKIVRAKRRLESAVEETEGFDLLIIGAPSEDRLVKAFAKSFEDRLAELAKCSVFQVQSPREHSHDVVAAVPEAIQAEGFRLYPFLHLGVVDAKVDVKDKAALFSHISAQFAEVLGREIPRSGGTDIPTKDSLEAAFWQRERIQNTAMSRGVAMPHAVIPELDYTLFGVFTLLQPLDFASPDRSAVDVCIVTVGPSEQRGIHLKILGRAAYLIRETDLLDQLRAAETDIQLANALIAVDDQS
jgi:amino acid transporter/mannitol/fructose-specific phosphotransferase system IIA component (Ntr-type)